MSSVLDPESPLPSFFEMFMTHQIQLSLKPALGHVLSALSGRLPFLSSALFRLDETYLLLSLAIEGKMLGQQDCLLAESLYGLRRSRIARDGWSRIQSKGGVVDPGVMSSLTARDRRKALLLAVAIPYLKAKLDAAHTTANEEDANQRDGLSRAQKVLLAAYPILHTTYEGSYLVAHWMYNYGRTPYFSPLLYLLGQVVRRTTMEDVNNRETEKQAADALASASDSSVAPSFIQRVGGGAVRYGRVAVFTAVILFKVAEWWTQVEARERGNISRRRGAGLGVPIPPPPLPPTRGQGSTTNIPRDPHTCPLCLEPQRINPAVCSVSGYVFCYRCILQHVRAHGACPISMLPCGVDSVVKLFEEPLVPVADDDVQHPQ